MGSNRCYTCSYTGLIALKSLEIPCVASFSARPKPAEVSWVKKTTDADASTSPEACEASEPEPVSLPVQPEPKKGQKISLAELVERSSRSRPKEISIFDALTKSKLQVKRLGGSPLMACSDTEIRETRRSVRSPIRT